MPAITITLTDTPTGGVAVHTDFAPAIGAPCSPAQAAALDIMARTKRDWGVTSGATTPAPAPAPMQGVNIDAVHTTRKQNWVARQDPPTQFAKMNGGAA